MSAPLILAIDQGTTNTKALLIGADGTVRATASAPLKSAYPKPGWAEQSAVAIWDSVRAVITDIVAKVGSDEIAGVAIANQRESLVVWDAKSGEPLAPCILWQCRRTADRCAKLIADGQSPVVEERTGLAINPLFPASKLGWIMDHVPAAGALSKRGLLRAGTVDSWLLWNLTGGESFATDHSNASRTQLFNTAALGWDNELCDLFGAPRSALAETKSSDSLFGTIVAGATALPAGVPVLAIMGDSHAALYGHGIRAPGQVKATYGTGSSLMALTPGRIASQHGLSGTIAWSTGTGVSYAIEGNITVSAQAAAFMANMLGLPDAAALSDLAQKVPDSGGVTFLPALAGLGAPHWDDRAKGAIDGLTLGSKPAHVARATFEAIALQICDVFTAMEADIGAPLECLRSDGGASANGFLMQLQADLLGRKVLRSSRAEIGALGVAKMAFSTLGIDLEGQDDTGCTTFTPAMPGTARAAALSRWHAAIRRAKTSHTGG